MQGNMIIGTSLLCFYFYLLCYAAVFLKVTYYAQYYTQEHELLSDYYAFYMQFCMNNSADNFYRYQNIQLCSINSADNFYKDC